MGKETEFVEAVYAEQFAAWIERDVLARIGKVTCEDDLRFGPEYCVTTSKGLALRIPTVYVRNWKRYGELYSNVYKILFIFACDTCGHLLGYMSTELCSFEKDGYVGGWGEIFLRQGGSGLCLPVEMVHMDLLQREADLLKTKVSFGTGNDNLKYLQGMQEVLKNNPSDPLAQWVETLEAEQFRWQQVYGSQGMLGFDTVGCRMFYPGNQDCLEPEEIGKIKLVVRKVEEKGRLLAYGDIVSQETVTDKEALRERRLKSFRQELWPQIRTIASCK